MSQQTKPPLRAGTIWTGLLQGRALQDRLKPRVWTYYDAGRYIGYSCGGLLLLLGEWTRRPYIITRRDS